MKQVYYMQTCVTSVKCVRINQCIINQCGEKFSILRSLDILLFYMYNNAIYLQIKKL